ncbi:MAG TPA: protein phosphatase 2C domain-containing protein [Thermoguttaceae bacterium]|nr:protein phosphatase 2C domain-containing protein [Thermoguttaceae bacterium]
MPFHSRVFKLAKDIEHPEEDQDAYALDAAAGIAVVADGVSSAIFSRQWAGVLAEAVIADTPDPDDKEAFARWLAERRQAWSERIDTSGLAWFQKAKLPVGAFSTLLWVRLLPVEEQQEGAFGAFRLQGFAIGDSCLLHVRHGEVLRTFPVQKAEEFQDDPVVLGSVDLSRDHLMEFTSLDELCYADDLLVLCTDAIGEWALRSLESGKSPDWDAFWNMTQPQWEDEITRLRQQQEMRYDDATLVLLRVAAEGVEVGQPKEPVASARPPELPPPPVPDDPRADTTEEDDWKEKLKLAGKQVAEEVEEVSGYLWRGLKQWKDKAVEKYRERYRPDDR